MLTAQIQTYIVWNVEGVECETYAELVALESTGTYSYSSRIETHDIEALVKMLMNEFNGTMAYHLVPAPTQH